jgi:two-component system chemotaxis response regulator CheY
MKVLIVDDSVVMRRIMMNALSQSGITDVEQAKDGNEGVAKAMEDTFDLVLMDWNMPIMDGYDALVKIREDEQFNDVQVLMATSEGIQEDISRATKAGANGYMVKPFTLQQLADKIKELIED